MKHFLPCLFLPLLLYVSVAFAHQKDSTAERCDSIIHSENAIYFELLGTSYFLYSINYDRLILDKSKIKGGFRIGYGAGAISNGSVRNGSAQVVPFELNTLLGQQFYKEFGLGATFYVKHTKSDIIGTNPADFVKYYYLNITCRAGIRVQPLHSGWVFRIGFTPTFYCLSNDEAAFRSWTFGPWMGLSVGRSF